jgi:hypothetical protein
MIAGQIETDNNIFSLGNTTVSMKATLYSVSYSGAETIVVPSQYIISPSNLNFTTHDIVSGDTSFNLAPLLGHYRIRIEAKAFGDEIENRTYDFWVYNPATILVNMWATPSSVYYNGTSVIHWQNYPTNGISCWWADASGSVGTSGSFPTANLTNPDNIYSIECNNGSGGQVVSGNVDVQVISPAITASAVTPISSTESSYIDYSAVGSKSCNIIKTDSVGGVTDSGGNNCPTSGRYYTGALTNAGTSNITTHYTITCGVGSGFDNPATGDCNGPGASGTMAMAPSGSFYGNTQNNVFKVAIIEKIKNLFSNIIPKIFAADQPSGDASTMKDVSIVIKPAVAPPASPLATLTFDQTQIKNVVKKGVANPNGTTPVGTAYLTVDIRNLTSGGCKLKNNGVEVDNFLYQTGYSEVVSVSNLLNPTNNFQLTCLDSSSPSLTSDIVSVKAQSGDLAGPISCTIPIGGSSCPSVTLNWDTTSPYTTAIGSSLLTKITRESTTVFSPSNTGTGVTNVPYSAYGAIYMAKNTVDGEWNTISAPTTAVDELDTITINTICANGSTWSIANGKCEATSVPIPPTGVISSPDCLIPIGSGSCNTLVKWETFNPKIGFMSAVTTPTNIVVGTGNTNNTGVSYPVAFGIRQFFLYHDGEPPLADSVAWADCVAGASYNPLSKKCESTTNTTGVLNAPNCFIATGASSCVTHLTWTTTNPKFGVTSSITTPTPAPTGTVVTTGNNSSLPFSYSMAYGARNFYLNHNNVVLSNKTARAMCSAFIGDIWNGTICAKPTTGSLTATNCVIPGTTCHIL